jgi:sulfotransferase
MSTTIHFISGLPRSGSTLLANLLTQNPRFHSTATSGILEILFLVRNSWDKVLEFRAAVDRVENEAEKIRVLRGILQAYHSERGRPVVFDKSRSWLAHLELAEKLLERPAKVLVPVRDVREVLASFERLWRSSSATGQVAQEANNYAEFQTIKGRCDVWMRGDQPVGLALNRIKDALHRGFADRMHFVRFEQLTQNPGPTLRAIYDFLGEPWFEHDFNNVAQVTAEDDRVFGFPDLHTIRAKVEPVPIRWPEILGEVGQRHADLEVW